MYDAHPEKPLHIRCIDALYCSRNISHGNRDPIGFAPIVLDRNCDDIVGGRRYYDCLESTHFQETRLIQRNPYLRPPHSGRFSDIWKVNNPQTTCFLTRDRLWLLTMTMTVLTGNVSLKAFLWKNGKPLSSTSIGQRSEAAIVTSHRPSASCTKFNHEPIIMATPALARLMSCCHFHLHHLQLGFQPRATPERWWYKGSKPTKAHGFWWEQSIR